MNDQELLREEVEKRRTFAIISHPDAGKTTLTEKLLLYSGMIQTAGVVKGRKGRKSAASDWMKMEQERGISITSSAMQFTYKNTIVNVLDTPGHEDFSEDTYRTLTAADCAIMVIDASKGVEKQTRKLFEVCHLRNIPVLTFINKMDMPGRDPLDLMNEVEKILQIDSFAMNWPIGSGSDFKGVVDRTNNNCLFFTKTSQGGALKASINTIALQTDEAKSKIGDDYEKLIHELDILEYAGNAFSKEAFLNGKVTPVFFASALTNFGVEPFFDAFIHLAPCPHARLANRLDGEEIEIDPITTPFSGYVFKVQANMDKHHRDSMAFIRICSGRFERNLVVKNVRSKKDIRLSRPHGMMAKERTTLDLAYPGDIIGVINPSLFEIGDTISLTGGFIYKPMPLFQPEIFAKIYPKDVGKRKSYDKGILQLINEGTIQMLKSKETESLIFAAVGQLQFEVMQYRLKDEYGVETVFTPLPYHCSAWIIGDLQNFKKSTSTIIVEDKQNRPMALFASQWDKEYSIRHSPDLKILDVLV